MSFEPLFRAVPVPRGCGDRTPGGLYVESGLGPGGEPLEHFLVDPPLPIPEGLDLVNKPQIVEDPATGIPHLWLWIGAEWYLYTPDYIEETRRYGASRKLNPTLDITRLIPSSRMILAHPSARNTLWREQALPRECLKRLPGHALTARGGPDAAHQMPLPPVADGTVLRTEVGQRMPPSSIDPVDPIGPCLFKTYELMPVAAATDTQRPALVADRAWYTRHIGSTTYLYAPSGEPNDGLVPGVFAALPITGFALIRHSDGTVNDKAEAKLREAELPYYASFQ